MAFHFRQFDLHDDQSTMRVGTDAVLLGAWVNPGNIKNILDIGTGCGILALMMAQKSNALIKAIDVDKKSVGQASMNFLQSPWFKRMKAIQCSLQEMADRRTDIFDLVVTNPPYFSNSLKSPDIKRNTARHDDLLNSHDLLAGVIRLVNEHGKFCLILPAEITKSFCKIL